VDVSFDAEADPTQEDHRPRKQLDRQEGDMDYYRDQLMKDRQHHLMKEADAYRASRRIRDASVDVRRRDRVVVPLYRGWTRLVSRRSSTVNESPNREPVKV
jgi:hypothetical protein